MYFLDLSNDIPKYKRSKTANGQEILGEALEVGTVTFQNNPVTKRILIPTVFFYIIPCKAWTRFRPIWDLWGTAEISRSDPKHSGGLLDVSHINV